MIHSVQIAHTSRQYGRRRQLGVLPAFDPISAGISVGVGLAQSAIGNWMNSIQQSHNADTATTLIVNGLASQLQNLNAAYFAENPPSCADQRAALDAYDEAWQWLQSPAACGNPNYGRAGNACISDRAPGGPYPWQSYYRDPIANDPRLTNAGCDTTQEVLLPGLSTGIYAPSGITAAGKLTVPPQPVAADAPSSSPAPAAPSLAAIPPVFVIAALGIGAYLVTR